MKKLLPILFALAPGAAFAQVGTDTLLWDNFNSDPSVYQIIGVQSGTNNDTNWYNINNDMLSDGSGQSRPEEWFWSQAFAPSDTIPQEGVLASNSWTNDGVNPVEDWLISPYLIIADTTADLFWKSAPRQTPRYCDGYMVLISTTTNDFASFTDTVFVASEYTSLDDQNFPNNYASYTFTPASGFVHGFDGTYTEYNATSDSSRLYGVLRTFHVDLSGYAGQNIYIAFVHQDIDDNLISIDDIFVEGTDVTGINEVAGTFPMEVYPNPANDAAKVNFTLPAASDVTVNIYSLEGALISSENLGNKPAGSNSAVLNVNNLSAGVYLVSVQTETGITSKRIVVQ